MASFNIKDKLEAFAIKLKLDKVVDGISGWFNHNGRATPIVIISE